MISTSIFAPSYLPVTQRADAMGAQCPPGSNLYNASIISAVVTYEDAFTQRNVTIDIVQHPNATISLDVSDNYFFQFIQPSSDVTFRTSPTSASGNNSVGAVDVGGDNGEFEYAACISPVQANTTYTGQSIDITHPASSANYSQIDETLGGSTLEFWIHWIYPPLSTLTISTVDKNGSPLPGYYSVLNQSGSVLAAGTTPTTFSLNDNQVYTVQVDNYANCNFAYWADDGSTLFYRVVSISTNTTLTAVMSCATTTSSTSYATTTSSSISSFPASSTISSSVVNTATTTLEVTTTASNMVNSATTSTSAPAAPPPQVTTHSSLQLSSPLFLVSLVIVIVVVVTISTIFVLSRRE